MSLPCTVTEILAKHVTLEVEGIDRMYLNAYVPRLQCEIGVVRFFRLHRGAPVASSALMDPMTKAFVAGLEDFAQRHDVPIVKFEKGQRKDDVAKEHLRRFQRDEGVLFLGKAQEKTSVFRTESRINSETGKRYPRIVRSTAVVNQFYVYAVDSDFGPFFLKFCSYFPYTHRGFSNRDLREHLAPMLGIEPSRMTQGRMSYDLRRLRLHGLIERIPKSHRYRVTRFGLQAALFFTRVYNRVLRPGLAHITPVTPASNSALRTSFHRLDKAVEAWCEAAQLAA